MAGTKRARRLQVLPGGKSPRPAPGVAVRTSSGVLKATGPAESQRYEILLENASDAILAIEVESGLITTANHAALELTGYLRDELVGKHVSTLFPQGGIDLTQGQALEMLHVQSDGLFEDIVVRAKDGYPRYVSFSARSLELDGKRVAMCIIRDVGEKKRMERDLITKHTELRNAYVSLEKANAELKAMQETLVQSGKLAALGELAAGIAHELNQPLTAVKGFAQEARAASKDAHVTDCLSEVVTAAGKMEKIISHLRNFTRKSTEDFQWVDVHAVVDESLVMLGKQLASRGVRIKREFAASLPRIWCNPFQLEQVFINLATNARDAIEARHAGDGEITIVTRAGDGFIEVRFSDNGCGIAEAAKGKIFNPFFTTKEVGRGMGLGLSISYGILSRINASILVESALGRGTTFTIKLPVDYRAH